MHVDAHATCLLSLTKASHTTAGATARVTQLVNDRVGTRISSVLFPLHHTVPSSVKGLIKGRFRDRNRVTKSAGQFLSCYVQTIPINACGNYFIRVN